MTPYPVHFCAYFGRAVYGPLRGCWYCDRLPGRTVRVEAPDVRR